MELLQKNSPKFAADPLPFYDDEFDTGIMTECVTVIVACYWDGKKFRVMRGYHAGSGFGNKMLKNVNFDSLLANIPNDPSTYILVVAGPENYSLRAMRNLRRIIDSQLQTHNLGFVSKKFLVGTKVKVNRNGDISGDIRPRTHRDDV